MPCNPSMKYKDKPISEKLRRDVADRQLAQHHPGASINKLLQLVVEDIPLSINDSLVVLDIVDADFGVFLLALELKLDVENGNLKRCKILTN